LRDKAFESQGQKMMEKNDEVVYMTDDEIMNLKVSDLRELTPDEKINDNLRRDVLKQED
jgi:hypothetical protein